MWAVLTLIKQAPPLQGAHLQPFLSSDTGATEGRGADPGGSARPTLLQEAPLASLPCQHTYPAPHDFNSLEIFGFKSAQAPKTQ